MKKVDSKIADDKTKVFEEDKKSADEFLKKVNQFISDMDELTPFTVNGHSI